jgi:hypothetical protein
MPLHYSKNRTKANTPDLVSWKASETPSASVAELTAAQMIEGK